LAPRSIRAYGDDIRLYIAPTLGGVTIGRLNPAHVRDLIGTLTRKGLAPSRVRRIVTVLGSALGQGVRDGALARNVAAAQRIRQRESDPFVATPETARRILAAIEGDRWENAWIVAIATGLRRGELLGLRWGDVDLEGASLAVRRQRGQGGFAKPKTTAARRSIPLPGLAVAALRSHRGARIVRPETPVFDAAPSTITHAWIRTVRRTGLPPMRLHDLRHATATLMLATGTPMRVIADTLGHSSPAITARVYAHVVPAAQRESADRLDAALRGAG
jgi:integrase